MLSFLMSKYNFTYHDWFGPLNVNLKKIKCYVIKCALTDGICTATAIRELCDERDTYNKSDVHTE